MQFQIPRESTTFIPVLRDGVGGIEAVGDTVANDRSLNMTHVVRSEDRTRANSFPSVSPEVTVVVPESANAPAANGPSRSGNAFAKMQKTRDGSVTVTEWGSKLGSREGEERANRSERTLHRRAGRATRTDSQSCNIRESERERSWSEKEAGIARERRRGSNDGVDNQQIRPAADDPRGPNLVVPSRGESSRIGRSTNPPSPPSMRCKVRGRAACTVNENPRVAEAPRPRKILASSVSRRVPLEASR
ncbi:hypothetical protein KM043_005470 [Ampulex compressa]|nr:hypothetical protein KM043_005470 [Ampulex compressa]